MPRGVYPRPSPEERFWSKVDVGDCWLWAGPLRDGYGRFWLDGRFHQAHRWLYEYLVEPIPSGFQMDHLCKTRSCVNPDHLEVVTQRENMERSTVWRYNRIKTHCPRGHALEGDNVYWTKAGRCCLECKQAHTRAFNQRISEERRQRRERATV